MNFSAKARKAVASVLAVSTVMWAAALTVAPVSAAAHNDGCLVNVNGTVYLITGGMKRGFTSAEVFMSHGYNFGQVVAGNSDDAALPTGAIQIYADGTLVKGPNDPLVYLVVNGQKRGFTSGAVFTGLGYSFANIQWAPVNTFSDIPTGANINSTSETGLPHSGPGPRAVNCGSTPSTPSGPLQGGAGSVESYNLLSGLGNEEVGEDSGDVEVAGLEIEVDDGSDLEFTAVRLVFDEGTAASDFEDYADEVSVMMDGDEVARVDADEFNDDNDWTKTVSLDGAVIEAGETGELVVAVSGVSNLDSADVDDTWTLDFRQVRFVDADGATVSEDPTENAVTFSFTSFASSTDVELNITEGDEAINDAHVVDVHATDETEDVEILAFNMDVDGDSDVTLDAMPITVTVGGAQDNVDEMISSLTLMMDGDEIATASIGADCRTDADCAAVGASEDYLFDDLDLDLESGEEHEFVLLADIYGITDTGDVAAGDTILARLSETETDDTDFDAEDESGEQLADADIIGAVTAEASTVYDVAFDFELLDTAGSITTQGDAAAATPTDDIATFTIEFELTAFGGAVSIDKSCVEAQADAADQGTEFTITNGGSNTPTCSVSSTASTNSNDSDAWTIEEGETETFTLTVATSAVSADHFAKVYLTSINFDDDVTDTSPDLFYSAGLGEDNTSTPEVFINNN
jgi:hypothetical protein